MRKQEILAPERYQVARQDARADVPAVNMGGYVNRTLATWHHNGQARAIDALTRHNVAERGLFEAQTALVHAGIKLADALALARDTPERHDHELALRRLHREDGLNEAVHTFKQNVLRREKEMECSEADVITARSLRRRAEVVLEDADQQLRAQRDFGYFTHELAHKNRALEAMDIELDVEERKALLRNYLARGTEKVAGSTTSDAEDAEIEDALQMRLQQLNAAGMDTSRVEAAIAARRRK